MVEYHKSFGEYASDSQPVGYLKTSARKARYFEAIRRAGIGTALATHRPQSPSQTALNDYHFNSTLRRFHNAHHLKTLQKIKEKGLEQILKAF
jgi:hypothetical protein